MFHCSFWILPFTILTSFSWIECLDWMGEMQWSRGAGRKNKQFCQNAVSACVVLALLSKLLECSHDGLLVLDATWSPVPLPEQGPDRDPLTLIVLPLFLMLLCRVAIANHTDLLPPSGRSFSYLRTPGLGYLDLSMELPFYHLNSRKFQTHTASFSDLHCTCQCLKESYLYIGFLHG